MSERSRDRAIRTRRGFLAALLGTASLAAIASPGCSSDGDGDYGQKFDKPNDPAAGAASAPPETATKRRSQDIAEDRENAKKKSQGKGKGKSR